VENANRTSSDTYILDEVKEEKCCMEQKLGVIYLSSHYQKEAQAQGEQPLPLTLKGEKL
jgi:hypothetical protein